MRRKALSVLDGRRPYQIVVALFIIVCLIIGISCFRYYNQLQETVENESSGYLQEISKQISRNASRTISDNFAMLGSISSVLKNADMNSAKQMQQLVLNQQKHWNYQSVMLIDENGYSYSSNGNNVSMAGDEYLMETIIHRKNSLSASQVIDGKECIIFAIPVDTISIDGKKMSALAASYDLSTLDQVLSMDSFNGQGYAYIIQKDGAVVVRSSSKNALKTGYNLLNTISSYPIKNSTSAQLKQSIESGSSGMIELSIGETKTYMTYTPLDTKNWYLLTFVPKAVANAKSEFFIKLTFFMCSAITILFILLFAYLMFSSYRHKLKLERIAYIDPVTGGHTEQRFYTLTENLLNSQSKYHYALTYINIEKFKVMNDQFGRDACDDMLKTIYNIISSDLSQDECMGRLTADNFCVVTLYSDDASLINRFESWYAAIERNYAESHKIWLSPTMEFGVYLITNDTISISHMIDRAKLALRDAAHQHHGRLHCAVYDDNVRQQLFREKHLEDMMENALATEEFKVYLQPKYATDTEQIDGAEALVRWVSKTEGMIFPDEFITLFEKNGFIIQLDLWVFKKVCMSIASWIEQGLTPVKISVNCSRVHIKNPNFLDRYVEICQACKIPPEYIEIELTENVVFEDVENLTSIINDIHDAGFGCSMDDFGSGYSSLNLIQYIPVDTIKLDRVFFKSAMKDLGRTESVVGSIISMSKLLNMKTVAEGVEDRPVVDVLKRLGCDLIQGYYFAKPMPLEEFEALSFHKLTKKEKGVELTNDGQ